VAVSLTVGGAGMSSGALPKTNGGGNKMDEPKASKSRNLRMKPSKHLSRQSAKENSPTIESDQEGRLR
jgi:hypothetical protein